MDEPYYYVNYTNKPYFKNMGDMLSVEIVEM